MRYFRIFLIHIHRVIENRSRSIVWTLMSVFNPLVYLCFWFAVYKSTGKVVGDWSLSDVTSYYLLLTIGGSFLIAHIDESVAIEDIYEGGLVKWILRPFSYFWDLYFGELGWRVFQGAISIAIFIILSIFLGQLVKLVNSPLLIVLAILSIFLAYSLSFIFKMILGLSAFWLTEFRGLQSTVEVVLLVFGGFIIPLHFLPLVFQKISFVLPFAYMVYFPILAVQGSLSQAEIMKVIIIQVVWIGILGSIYQVIWQRGLRVFTGVGQ